MRSHRTGCAYVAGANFDLSNITKKGRTRPKRKLINQLVRLSGGSPGCKLPSRQLPRMIFAWKTKMAPGNPAPRFGNKLRLLRAGQSGMRKSGRVGVAERSTDGIRLCSHFEPLQQRYDLRVVGEHFFSLS